MRRRNSAFSNAFSTTLFGSVFLFAGAIGYEIKKSDWSFVAGGWSNGPIWWEIWLGVISLTLAAFFWRSALRMLP